ncbi:Protein F47B7.1, partial [Aphelenchoides avenae]
PSAAPAGLSSDDAKMRLMERLIIRAKRLRPAFDYPPSTTRFYGFWTKQQILECIFSVFVPPVAVFIHGGRDMVGHFVVNSILWIFGFAVGPVVLGWVPGPVHAFWYCFCR